MSRAAENQAKSTYNDSKASGDVAKLRQNQTYGDLFPFYQQEMKNPNGFNAYDLSKMNTGVQQSLGGSVAGVVGQGNLQAARTRNAGGYQAAMSDEARNAQEQQSDKALEVNKDNALLRESNRQAGAEGMEKLNSSELSGLLASLGLRNQSTDTLSKAGQSGWFQNFITLMNSLKASGSTAGGGGFSVGG